ncbi:hypothetical protein E4U57_004409 [Claviceps arundinis]|uniref:Alcohol acetyltransferase n=1 Tax=Claviceps arundinis TaxID=1623583 RepID=A0ABQ7PKR8_9HYPO|nr:hypothetical protein E4U57_004409 [Claviceps arundinis]
MGLYLSVVLSCRYTSPVSALSPSAEVTPSTPSSPSTPTSVSPRPTPHITPSLLYAALKRLILAQPMLHVGILDQHTNAARFCHIPHLDLTHHVSFSTLHCNSEQEYDEAISALHAQHHDQRFLDVAQRPAWRIEVVEAQGDAAQAFSREGIRAQDVVFAYHHALLDGTSGRMFHEDLLRQLNRLLCEHDEAAEHNDLSAAAALRSIPLPPAGLPALQALIPASLSPIFVVTSLWTELAPAMLCSRPPPPWHAALIDLARPYVTRTIPVSVPRGLLDRLLTACRSHGTSLTGLVHVLTLVSLTARLPAREAMLFCAATPISLRPYLPRDLHLEDMLSVLVTTHLYDFAAPEITLLRSQLGALPSSSSSKALTSLMWSLAHDLKTHLTTRTSTLPRNDLTALLRFVPDWFAYFRKKDGQPRRESWELSNIGVLDLSSGSGFGTGADTGSVSSPQQKQQEQDDDAASPSPQQHAPPSPRHQDNSATHNAPALTISRAYFTNGAMPVGPPFGLGLASVPGGPLTIGLSWQEGVVPASLMRGLADDLEGYVRCFDETGFFCA